MTWRRFFCRHPAAFRENVIGDRELFTRCTRCGHRTDGIQLGTKPRLTQAADLDKLRIENPRLEPKRRVTMWRRTG